MTDNLRGAILMVLAMLGFAIEDTLIKTVYRDLPVGEILMIFGAGGMLVFAAFAVARGQRVFHPAVFTQHMAVRAGFELSGRLFYTLAIALTPLSSASAILQATPLVVTLGAALVFHERVGALRWAAILAGLAGVLMILRPGAEGFSALSILAVLGTLGFAGRDLATRAAPPVLSNLQLGVWGFAVLIPAGAILLAWTGGAAAPSPAISLRLALTIGVGVAAYLALTAAMRIGEVAAVTPLRYTRLVFALLIGVLLLGERPDALTLIGAAIVVGSGLVTILAGRRG